MTSSSQPDHRRIIVCEAGPLTPERDAGSRAVVDLINALRTLGHAVTVLIESHGALVDAARAADPDLVVISRPGLFLRLEPLLRPLGAPIIYWASDLHFERFALHARIDPAVSAQPAAVMRLVEEACFRRADLAVLPTSDEVALVRVEFPGAAVMSTPYFDMPEQRQPTRPPATERLVFIGGENHAPNRDGIEWFVAEVWPRICDRRPAAELVVVGAWARAAAARPGAPHAGITFTGVLDDADLDELLSTARLGIAPLRFGAGMKRKTLHYLSHGVPVVGTGYAVQGLSVDADGNVPGVDIVASADEWVARIETLMNDEGHWMRQSGSGAQAVRQTFSSEAFLRGIARVVTAAG